jgi:DHA2 family multidrug resistance protein
MAYSLDWKPKHNPWAIALTVTLATFMEVLDTSIANVALPHIAGSVGASQDEATWVLTSYLVSSAVILPISGWLSDRFGRKRFYLSCVVMFTACSMLCGLAPTLPFLIIARVLQGLGGGGLAPSEQAILADTFPVEKRGQAFAVYGMAVVVAPAIGPTLGGWITDNFNWHWIFFINVPIGLFSLWLSSRMVEDPPALVARREAAKGTRVDFTGLALVASGVGVLEFFLDKGQEKDWFGDPFILTAAIIAGILLVTFVFWEWNHPDPIVDLKLLKNRNFGTAVFLQLILGMVLFGSTVLIPQYLQVLLGFTAQLAGEALSPAGFVMMFMMFVAGRLIGKMDPRVLVCIGYTATALGLYNLTRLSLDTSFATITEWRMLQVIGLPLVFIPISTLNYVGVPTTKMNQISSLSNFARNLGGSAGTALLTTFLARTAQTHQQQLAAHTGPGSIGYQRYIAAVSSAARAGGMNALQAHQTAVAYAYQQMVRQASMLSYKNAFGYLATVILCLTPLPFIMRLPPKRQQPPPEAMEH